MFNVYKIVNSINNKVYVGRTIHSLESRWLGHMKCLERGDMRQLYCAMRKYGVENFHIELIEEYNNLEDMIAGEAYYCDFYDSYKNGYNMTTAGEINPMECSKSKMSHDLKMRSKAVKIKISNTMKQVRAKSKNHIYIHKDKQMKRIDPCLLDNYIKQGWIRGTIKGKIRLHNNEGLETTVFLEDVDKYIRDGWKRGGKHRVFSETHLSKLRESNKNKSDKFKKEQSIRLKKYYQENPNWKTKSKKKVKITNPDTNEALIFDSCINMCRNTDIPESLAKSGKVGYWVKNKLINYKKSMYNNWKIEFIK